MNIINSYEDRVKNSHLQLINFEYIITHPMAKYEIVHRYNTDTLFKFRVDEERLINTSFNYKWNKYFSSLITNNSSITEKPKIKAKVIKFI